MGAIPDEIRRHRLPGTEIKRVGGRYYIQSVKCVWVPELKRRRKDEGAGPKARLADSLRPR